MVNKVMTAAWNCVTDATPTIYIHKWEFWVQLSPTSQITNDTIGRGLIRKQQQYETSKWTSSHFLKRTDHSSRSDEQTVISRTDEIAMCNVKSSETSGDKALQNKNRSVSNKKYRAFTISFTLRSDVIQTAKPNNTARLANGFLTQSVITKININKITSFWLHLRMSVCRKHWQILK